MVRRYRKDPVPDEVIERILRVIRHSPTAGFSQGQRLLVITDEETRDRVAEITKSRDGAKELDEWISHAPVHVALCVDESAYRKRYDAPDKVLQDGRKIPWPVPFWWFDAGALLMALQLAAINEGLVSGFFHPGLPEKVEELAQVIEVPDGAELAGILTIGYAADSPHVPDPRLATMRVPLGNLVRWQRPPSP
ncbi:nitroreductase family protein [Streptomyces sp. NPDC004096]|uniref:nitroreductase family protein n=1 Tax=unclassified Streptomyces TaxID=2593676 RepID=UPI0033A2DF87